jgi:eukaryotic-like serine/threonine-protein kinase
VEASVVGVPVRKDDLVLVPKESRSFGRYHLYCRLAKGGMANLYLAQYAGPDGFEKLVAIKRIHDHLSEDADFVTMFSDEARLAARISHPHVVQVLELGTVGSACFIAMEYVDGESLGALIRRTKIPLPLCARILSQAALGLHSAHELKDIQGNPLGVIHRDVSPQNVLVSYDGVVKVVDFGVAKAKSNVATTETGAVKGKFAYMAPEQLKPEDYGGQDRRTDVFPLGILLYEATTRKNLFKGKTDGQTIDQALNKLIKPLSQIIPGYPPALEKIVMRALERHKEDRYQTAHDMHVELEDYLSGGGTPVLPSDIAELMQRTFKERVEIKADMLRQARETALDHTGSISLHALRDSSVSVPSVAPRRRVGLIVAIVAALLAVLGVGVLLLRPAPPAPRARPSKVRKTAPGPIHIVLKASPENATIQFEGKAVPNPFEARRRREQRKVGVKVEAPGYVSRTFQVSLAEGGHLMVALEKLAPPRPDAGPKVEPKKAPKRPRRRPRRPGKKKPGAKVIKDLLKNPYGQ